MNSAQLLFSKAGAALGLGMGGEAALIPPGSSVLGRLLNVDALESVSRFASQDPFANFFDRALSQLGMQWTADHLDRIPKTGRVIIASNHPLGMPDGLVLGSLMSQVRPDTKFLANPALKGIVPDACLIPLDPFEQRSARQQNARALRRALEWLDSDGAIVIYPSGEVASLQLKDGRIHEPAWKDTVARLACRMGAAIVPVHLSGTNSPTFHVAGCVHPRLRTALLPREMFNKQGLTVHVSVGKRIPAAQLEAYPSSREATAYLEWRSRLLGAHPRPERLSRRVPGRQPAPLTAAANPETMAAEIAVLPLDQLLLSKDDTSAYFANASQIQATLHEIGRLRELSFRAVGEGTGQALDLDAFDQTYLHLFLWNHRTKEVIGAYRMAPVNPATEPGELYTNTLFRFNPALFRGLGPALELGRSFVRPEYQKAFQSLLMLWKGIGAFVAQRPKYRVLFGAVSISADYGRDARATIADFIRRKHWHQDWATLVHARGLFNDPPRGESCGAASLEHLSDAIQDLEGKDVPVLLRQYLGLGGKAAAMRIDRGFADALDVLVFVDLARAPQRSVERYLGKEGAAGFLSLHGAL